MSDPELAAAIRALEARAAVTELIHEYGRLLDLNRPDAVAELFTTDCLVRYSPAGGDLIGPAAVADYVRRALTRYRRTSHHMSNVQIGFVDANRASCTTYVLAVHEARDDAKPLASLCGEYRDVIVRTDRGWRFAERQEFAHVAVDMPIEWRWIERE